MGTTLTGTTPQDTYEALIKVGDNGIITGSLKTLSDGEGHDTALALSTGAASVTGTLAVSASASLATASGNVGVGTASPDQIGYQVGKILGVLSPAADATNVQLGIVGTAAATTGTLADINFFGRNGTGAVVNRAVLRGGIDGATNSNFFAAFTMNAGSLTEKLRITSAGNVGIGTSAPAVPLDVVGNIRSSTGILFGSDTAAANALDDYEEGTWTMGVSFGGASVAVTTSENTGTYTKIGRQVTVNGFIALTNKGSSSGLASITGLPFTVGSLVANYAAAAGYFADITFANQFMLFVIAGETQIRLREVTEGGTISDLNESDFSNSSGIMVGLTYFV